MYKVADTPIDLQAMLSYLAEYLYPDAQVLIDGFLCGFSLHFEGPPESYISKNHLSTEPHPKVLKQKIQKELDLGLMLGRYEQLPFPNFRCSAVGLVPKRSANVDPEWTDNWHFIYDLSTYPCEGAVNSWVSDEHGMVQYASFDMFIDALSKLGPGAKIAKVDLKSAFRAVARRLSKFKFY